MNSSSFIEPSVFVENSTMTIVESWFIPLDIFLIVWCILMISHNIFLLLIFIFDKTCHTAPMMLIANTYVSGLICGCTLLSMSIFTFQNDLKKIPYQDSLCVLRGYSLYGVGGIFNYSFALQAIYRYLIVTYPTRLFFQSFRFQILIICSSWLFFLVSPFLYLGQIIYNVDNQICQVPLSFSFSIIYSLFCMFVCPFSSIMFIYLKLIRHVREMGKNVGAGTSLIRAKRELKMVRRIVILITFLFNTSFPYALFIWMGFFNHAPKYCYRIAFTFIDVASLTSAIILCEFTDTLKEAIMKRIRLRSNRIVPSIT